MSIDMPSLAYIRSSVRLIGGAGEGGLGTQNTSIPQISLINEGQHMICFHQSFLL